MPEDVRTAAHDFVLREAGFAQVTTRDQWGFPVARTMTAFLHPDWSVELVQRRSHVRLRQLQVEPRMLVSWVGSPREGATNERPHVFDIGRLPPRAVFVRGSARFMDDAWTVERYLRAVHDQRSRGFDRAPLRDPEQAAAELAGVLVTPVRVRLEGFGEGAQSFDLVLDPSGGTT